MRGENERFLKGYVHVAMESPLPERFLNLCAFHRIPVWNLVNHNDTYSFCIYEKDFARLRPACRKTNTKLTVMGHYGLPFLLRKYKNRKMFPISIAICFSLLYALTLFIWQIDVTGLETHTAQEVIACLESLDVQYGMRKSEVDCTAIEAALRSSFSDFIWVAASIDGTELSVQVKENTESYVSEETEEMEGAADLTADVDGVIVQMVTRAGTPLVTVGEQVTAGQILISGREAYLNDSGEVLRYEEMQADGDVWIETTVSYEDYFTYAYEEEITTGRTKTGFELWLFGKHVTLLKGTNSYETAITSGERKTLVIGSRFYLPVDYQVTTVSETTITENRYTEEEAKALANENFAAYTEDLEKKGVEIIENSVTIALEENGCHTSGTLTVVMQTGTLTTLSPLKTQTPDNTEENE